MLQDNLYRPSCEKARVVVIFHHIVSLELFPGRFCTVDLSLPQMVFYSGWVLLLVSFVVMLCIAKRLDLFGDLGLFAGRFEIMVGEWFEPGGWLICH